MSRECELDLLAVRNAGAISAWYRAGDGLLVEVLRLPRVSPLYVAHTADGPREIAGFDPEWEHEFRAEGSWTPVPSPAKLVQRVLFA